MITIRGPFVRWWWRRKVNTKKKSRTEGNNKFAKIVEKHSQEKEYDWINCDYDVDQKNKEESYNNGLHVWI